MGWLPLVGSLKIYVSVAEYRVLCRSLLQKRPIILRSIPVAATPSLIIMIISHYHAVSYFISSMMCIMNASFLSHGHVSWYMASSYRCIIIHGIIKDVSSYMPLLHTSIRHTPLPHNRKNPQRIPIKDCEEYILQNSSTSNRSSISVIQNMGMFLVFIQWYYSVHPHITVREANALPLSLFLAFSLFYVYSTTL